MIFTEPSLVDKLVVKTHVFWGSSDPLSQGGEESPQGSLEQALAKTMEQNHELHESLGFRR